jgi:hypothetical protein
MLSPALSRKHIVLNQVTAVPSHIPFITIRMPLGAEHALWSLCRVQVVPGSNLGPKIGYIKYGVQNLIQEEINRRFNSDNV